MIKKFKKHQIKYKIGFSRPKIKFEHKQNSTLICYSLSGTKGRQGINGCVHNFEINHFWSFVDGEYIEKL